MRQGRGCCEGTVQCMLSWTSMCPSTFQTNSRNYAGAVSGSCMVTQASQHTTGSCCTAACVLTSSKGIASHSSCSLALFRKSNHTTPFLSHCTAAAQDSSSS
jgi:hypothetical protein